MTPPTRDHEQAEFVAELLRAEAGPIALRASRELTALHPAIVKRWGPVGGAAGQAWSEALQSRIHELAAAVLVRRPDLFVSQVRWARQAFESRGLPPEDLALSLGSLRDAVLDTLPQTDHAFIEPFFTAATAALTGRGDDAPAPTPAATGLGRLTADYLRAILEGDRHAAFSAIQSAVRDGAASVADVYDQVLTPAMCTMGRLWHLGKVNVAEEHFATSTTLITLSQLLPLWPRKAPNGRTLLAASVEGNLHEIGIRMVSDHLEAEGWRTIYLGPNVPTVDVAQAAADFRADLVCLSITMTVHLQPLRDAARLIRGARPEARILVGGPGLHQMPGLAAENGADAYAESPGAAIAAAARLVGLPA